MYANEAVAAIPSHYSASYDKVGDANPLFLQDDPLRPVDVARLNITYLQRHRASLLGATSAWPAMASSTSEVA